MIGHPQGASGAAGIVTSALALSRGFLPPTINQRERDPDCDLDFIANTGRESRVAAALFPLAVTPMRSTAERSRH